MNFLNPFVLIGLAAAAIPILLHLLNLRKTQTVEFSTLYFLKELKKSTIRTIKIKQWILLLLRTLLVIFAVLSFSQPIYNGTIPFLSTLQSNRSIIVLVDNTSSTVHSSNSGTLFSAMKNDIRNVVETMSESDELTFIPFVSSSTYQFSSNKQQLLEEITALTPSIASATISDAFQKIIALMAAAKHPSNSVIYVLSDNQTAPFEQLLIDSLEYQIPVQSIFYKSYSPTSINDEPNCSIDTIQFKTTLFRSGKPIELEMIVSNTSTKEIKTTVFCQFGTVVVGQQQITLQAKSSQRIPFSVNSTENGIVPVKGFLDNDSYEPDNTFFTSIRLNGKPNVLLIGSESKTQFVKNALQLPGGVLTTIRSIASTEIGNESFSGIQTVFIIDQLESIQPSFLTQLSEKGIGVFLFADASLETLQKFGQQFGATIPSEQSGNPFLQFTNSDRRHPLFRGVFKEDTKGMVESPKIYSAFPSQGGIPIIEIQGGAFLSEYRIGQSKILYCAVPASIKQSSFPLLSLFPVVLTRSVSYLSQSEGIGILKEGGVPITIEIPTSYKESSITLNDPNGLQTKVTPYSLPSKTAIQVTPLWQLGTYSILSNDKNPITSFSVNIPTNERKSISSSNENIVSLLQKLLPKNNVENLQNSKLNEKSLSKAQSKTELWQFFLTLALLCAFTELIVASQFREVAE